MKGSLVAIVLMLGGMALPSAGPTAAAELTAPRYVARIQVLPFSRSERAQSVWASDACWSQCGSYCAWGLAGCLNRDAQGQCVTLTDTCDRYCQRRCRSSGGPLLPLTD